MEYGLQLFSVRDVTERDMEGALRQVAEMGYRSVEFAGFFGHSAQEIKGWLDKYGLTASGTHTGMSELTGDKLQETIAYHQAIGCRNLIVPYESFATKGEIDAFIQRVQQVEPQLNAAGITLHYHNHDHEFKPNQDGLIPEEELLARTNLLLEVDTYWVYAAGKDPVFVADNVPGMPQTDCWHLDEVKDFGAGPVKEYFEEAVDADVNEA